MGHSSFERTLYKTYVFFLPLGRFIEFPFGDFINSMITQMSTWLMLLGVFILFLRAQGSAFRGVSCFGKLYFFMAIYSLVASFILLFTLDPHFVETPLRTCMGDIIHYLLALLSIYYNYYHLTHTIHIRQLYKIFDGQIIVLLIIGYLQLGLLLGIGPMASIYISLASVLSLADFSWLMNLDRGVCFFGSEPASASKLCLLVIPFILSSIYHLKKGVRWKYIIYLLLFGILMLMSNSSSVLVSFILIIAFFLFSAVLSKIKKSLYYISFGAGLLLALLYTADFHSVSDAGDTSDWFYVIYGKALDKENMSTAMRMSTVINDMKIFYSYPLTGIGNGNQGFFYTQNIPSWVRPSEEVQHVLSGEVGIINGGGNFFPAYLSGFGLIGIIVLFRFLQRYKQKYSRSFLRKESRIDWVFKLGVLLFLFFSWTVLGIKQNETMLFLLTLPCVRLSAA